MQLVIRFTEAGKSSDWCFRVLSTPVKDFNIIPKNEQARESSAQEPRACNRQVTLVQRQVALCACTIRLDSPWHLLAVSTDKQTSLHILYSAAQCTRIC